jgi:hypothetical protein
VPCFVCSATGPSTHPTMQYNDYNGMFHYFFKYFLKLLFFAYNFYNFFNFFLLDPLRMEPRSRAISVPNLTSLPLIVRDNAGVTYEVGKFLGKVNKYIFTLILKSSLSDFTVLNMTHCLFCTYLSWVLFF